MGECAGDAVEDVVAIRAPEALFTLKAVAAIDAIAGAEHPVAVEA